MFADFSIKFEENKCFISDLKLNKEDKFFLPNQNEIKWLKIQQSTIPRLSENILKSFSYLECFEAENIGIEEVSENAFVNNKNLKEISLNDNKVKELPKNLFNRNLNLESIDLEKNEIIALPKEIFDGLKKLNFLNLSSNNISNLSKKLFKDLKNLEILNINHNKLMDLKVDEILSQLPNLKEFTIRDTRFNLERLTYIALAFKNANVMFNTCKCKCLVCASHFSFNKYEGVEYISDDNYEKLSTKWKVEKLELKLKSKNSQIKLIQERLDEMHEKMNDMHKSLSSLLNEQKTKCESSNKLPFTIVRVEDEII